MMRIVIPACVMGVALFFGAGLTGCQSGSGSDGQMMQRDYNQTQGASMQGGGGSMQKQGGSMDKGN